MISVEVAGPNRPLSYSVIPDDIRGMAQYVIQECVEYRGGIGGFSTLGLGNLVNYVVAHQADPELGSNFRKMIKSE